MRSPGEMKGIHRQLVVVVLFTKSALYVVASPFAIICSRHEQSSGKCRDCIRIRSLLDVNRPRLLVITADAEKNARQIVVATIQGAPPIASVTVYA